MEEEYNYHEEEITFWRSKVTMEQMMNFLGKHRVEVLLQADCQYHCYINYKEGQGSDGIGLTYIGALLGAIYKYKE